MNGTEAAFSYTLKTPADNLLTVRGDDYDEFFNNLVAVSNDSELVDVLGNLQKAVGRAVAEGVHQGPARRGSAQPPRQSRDDDSPRDSDGHTCKHGEMVYKSGNKNGKSWAGHFCPVNDKMCKPVWSN